MPPSLIRRVVTTQARAAATARRRTRTAAGRWTAEETVVDLLLARPPAQRRDQATPITTRIHARLHDGDVAAIESRLEGNLEALHDLGDAATRRRLLLNAAATYELEPVLARAGLTAAMPPEDVHAMARGPVAAGGDMFTADLVFHALEQAGVEIPDGASVLDFGASSGRVLRVVAAGRPDLTCLGCDPNAPAIAWAAEHLPMGEFFVSPQRPPLPLADGSLHGVYAISIWSHFAEEPATAWLAEMHRVLAPGGALVLTTHGFDCLSAFLRRGLLAPPTAAAAATALVHGRHHFVDVFGADGDWGVQDAGWGNAYLPLEWLAAACGRDWALRLHWPGGLDQAQDVIVLERR